MKSSQIRLNKTQLWLYCLLLRPSVVLHNVRMSSSQSSARSTTRREDYVSRQSRGGSRYRGPSDSFTISAAVPASAISEDSGARDANDRSMNADQLVILSRQVVTSRPRGLVRDSVIRSHPSRGGSRGYPVTERQTLCDMWLLGLPVPRSRVRSIQRNFCKI